MTNGWPDAERPGVPLNLERDGWHWLHHPEDLRPVPTLWNAEHAAWCSGAMHSPQGVVELGYNYLGPCLTPAEVAALVEQARREEREACAAIADGYAKPNDINAWGTHEEILRAEGRENGAWEIANDIRA